MSLSTTEHRALQLADYVIWGLFALEYVSRITLAVNRFAYWWRHLPDLAIIALPVLRPLRLMRLVMLFRVLNRPMIGKLHGKVAVYGLTGAVLLVYCAAVGYGDKFPMTGEGGPIGAGLMVGGVALLAAVTASFATWLIDRLRVEETAAEATTHTDLAQLQEQLDRIEALTSRDSTQLREQLARIEAALGGPPQGLDLPDNASS